MLMGAADIVPGVSGGTMAFITGIYETLIDSLSAFNLTALKLVLGGEFRQAWEQVNGNFLLFLGLGIATSIISLAQIVSWLLATYPVPLWAFFFGLILASALMLMRQVSAWNSPAIMSLIAGALGALAIAVAPVVSLDFGLMGVFLAGFIAICAMILPGISGSFILILLGMYATVLNALTSLDLIFIGVFAVGAASGLLCFSRVLHWLLHKFREPTLALLTGFLFGSLAIVWPWKRVLEWVLDRHGELRPAQQIPVLPGEYLAVTGQDPAVVLSVALMVLGFIAVWLLDARWGRTSTAT
jgi:putative membrane protein